MFDYTQAAFKKILHDFKKLRIGITVGTHLLSIAYLIYALCTGTGFLIANIALLALTASYFVFFIIMESKAHAKKLKKRIKNFYGWCKRLIKLPVLGIAVYGLALSKTDFDPLSFLITIFMIIGWILDILFYFVLRFIEIEKAYLLDSLHCDTMEIPFFGERISSSIPQSENAEENYKRLTPFVEQVHAEREQKKQNRKQLKIDAKAAKKQAKKDEKAQKKAEKLAKKQQKKNKYTPEQNEVAGEIAPTDTNKRK